jgi:hypothetical protein
MAHIIDNIYGFILGYMANVMRIIKNSVKSADIMPTKRKDISLRPKIFAETINMTAYSDGYIA